MEYPFDELHVGIVSQILNLPTRISDSQAVMRFRFWKNVIKRLKMMCFFRKVRCRQE